MHGINKPLKNCLKDLKVTLTTSIFLLLNPFNRTINYSKIRFSNTKCHNATLLFISTSNIKFKGSSRTHYVELTNRNNCPFIIQTRNYREELQIPIPF